MLLDGKAIADELYAQLRERRSALGPISLGLIVIGVNPVIEQFVRIKSRAAESLDIAIIRRDLPESASTEEAIEAVKRLSPDVHALIVQLPMPQHIDVNAVLSEIPHGKDVDVINPRHSGEKPPIEAPVALAVVELLQRDRKSVV